MFYTGEWYSSEAPDHRPLLVIDYALPTPTRTQTPTPTATLTSSCTPTPAATATKAPSVGLYLPLVRR